MTNFKIVNPPSIPEVYVSQADSGVNPNLLSWTTPTPGFSGTTRFRFVIHNPTGAANISYAQIMVGQTWGTSDACYIHYSHDTSPDIVGLATDEATGANYWVGFAAIGNDPLSNQSATPFENHQCKISPNDVVAIEDNNLLILDVPITPTALLEGANSMYFLTGNLGGYHNSWQNYTPIQTWSPFPGSSPAPTYNLPASGSGVAGTYNSFDFTFSSSGSGGYRHMRSVMPLINTSFNGNQSCWIQFSPSRKTLILFNDGVTDIVSPGEVTLGTAVTLSNSHCSINVAQTAYFEDSFSSIRLRANIAFTSAWQNQSLLSYGCSVRRAGDWGFSYPTYTTWAVTSCNVSAQLNLQPSASTLSAGGTKQFTATTSPSGTPSWSVSGPGNINSSGLYTAPVTAPSTNQTATVSATYTVTGPNNCGTAVATKTATITIPAACGVQSLTVNPGILYNIHYGVDPIQLQAFANGSSSPVTNNITWSSSLPTYVSIDNTGLMRVVQVPNQLQIVTITAISCGVTATAQIQLSYFPIPQGVQVTPNSGYGAGQQFYFSRGIQPPNPSDNGGVITDVLFSSDVSVTTNTCYMVYASGAIQLRDNTGGYSSFASGNVNAALPAGNPPGYHLNGSAVNSQCTLNYYYAFTQGNFVERSWNVPLVFDHSFAGSRDIFVRVGQDVPFVKVGSWNVP